MINIELKNGQSGYDAVSEYIEKYWAHKKIDVVIVSIGTSYDGSNYDFHNEIAMSSDGDVDFLYDWWEGEKFIVLLGIQVIDEVDIYGGLYE